MDEPTNYAVEVGDEEDGGSNATLEKTQTRNLQGGNLQRVGRYLGRDFDAIWLGNCLAGREERCRDKAS